MFTIQLCGARGQRSNHDLPRFCTSLSTTTRTLTHSHSHARTHTRTSPSCPCRESYGPTARFTRKAALYFTQSLARALQTPATSEKHGSEDTTARQLVNQPAEQRETREHERDRVKDGGRFPLPASTLFSLSPARARVYVCACVRAQAFRGRVWRVDAWRRTCERGEGRRKEPGRDAAGLNAGDQQRGTS